MVDRFILTDTFVKSLLDFDKNLKATIVKCVVLLEKDIFHPSLHSEKIWNGIYTVRVNLANRIVHQPAKDKIRLLYVGSHDGAYRFVDNLKKRGVLVVRDEATEYDIKDLPLLKRLIKDGNKLRRFCRMADDLLPKDVCVSNGADFKAGLAVGSTQNLP